MCETPPAADGYFDSKELMQLLHMKKTKFYALIKDGDRDDPFPEPVVIMDKGYLWVRLEVDEWRARQPRGLKLPAQASVRKAQPPTLEPALDGSSSDTVPYQRRRRGTRKDS